MSNLKSEIRVDKNGTPVTRHVKVDEPIAVRVVANIKPAKAAKKVSKFISDPSFEEAYGSFKELNPDNAELFDDFFLGSSEEDDSLPDILEKNPYLESSDVRITTLNNGFVGYWIDEHHLVIPDNTNLSD